MASCSASSHLSKCWGSKFLTEEGSDSLKACNCLLSTAGSMHNALSRAANPGQRADLEGHQENSVPGRHLACFELGQLPLQAFSASLPSSSSYMLLFVPKQRHHDARKKKNAGPKVVCFFIPAPRPALFLIHFPTLFRAGPN